LSDVTGSRRFLCFTIPEGKFIDNDGEIDYEQLYAQIVYELRVLNEPYWFSNADVARIQELNLEYMEKKDIAEMIDACFRKPKEGENVKSLNCGEIIGILQRDYPSVKNDHTTKIRLGKAMMEMGYEHKEHSHVAYYKAVPRKVA
jgi:hypothetical protein